MHRPTHSNKSIDEILQSIRKVINNRDLQTSPYIEEQDEEELHLTEMLMEEMEHIAEEKEIAQAEKDFILSATSRAKTESILEDFIETATTLGHHRVKEESVHQPKQGSVEDFVMDLLRVQIKQWVDTNLPAMVKQIVSEEIKSLVANIQKNRS